jgi:NAD(P) transhydrogenase subunit alpha
MIGTAIGTIKPATFLVVGTGVVGLQAIATAKRLGGVVKAIDIRNDACTQADSLGAKVVEFDIPQELAVGKGGYAKALENEWLEIEQRLIAPIWKRCGCGHPQRAGAGRSRTHPGYRENGMPA